MTMKKLLALIVCLTMLTGVLAGCSGTDTTEPTKSGSQDTSAPTQSQAPADQPPADQPPADQPPADQPPADETQIASISYPLTGDDTTLSYWYYAPGYVKWIPNGNNDFMCVPYAEEVTGVALKFTEVSESTASEQFNLMIISGSWCDLIPASGYYTGGLSQAYMDDVVFDMTELVYEFMPDYVNILEQQDEAIQSAVLTEGMTLSFSTITDGSMTSGGVVTRGDWLNQIDFKFEKDYITLDEYVDLMRLLTTDFGAKYGYFLRPDGQVTGVAAAFDTSLPSLSGTSTSASTYIMNSKVVSGWTADGTRAYIEWLSDLIDEGLVDKDFVTDSSDQGVLNTAYANGEIAVWSANADKIDELTSWANEENKGIIAQAVPPIVANGASSAETKWLTETNLVSAGMSISATSEKGELACKYMNYFWTDEGIMLANYGVQGKSYDIDENGDWYWLELVTNEPQGANPEMASTLYSFSRFVSYYADHARLLPTFTDNAMSAVELWTQPGTSERQYPSFAGLTTEETDKNSTILTDICSYGQTELLSFITGNKPLNDDTWAEYLSTMDDLGLPGVLAVYQNAYEEYLAGERHIASATGGPGGGGGPPPM